MIFQTMKTVDQIIQVRNIKGLHYPVAVVIGAVVAVVIGAVVAVVIGFRKFGFVAKTQFIFF